ncbi:MAG TPA: hypothetical protein VGG33_23525 [Polyangia bacterium]
MQRFALAVAAVTSLATGCDDDGSSGGRPGADTRLEWPVDSGPFSTDVIRLDTGAHGDSADSPSDGEAHADGAHSDLPHAHEAGHHPDAGAGDVRDAHLDNHVHEVLPDAFDGGHDGGTADAMGDAPSSTTD